MEKRVYVIPEVNRERVTKTFARYLKKAERYGKMMSVSYGDTYSAERSINDVDEHGVLHKIDTELVQVFDLSVESEVISNDGWSVIARLDHGDIGNVVFSFTDESIEGWLHMKPFCSHCGCNHNLRKTFILRNANGEIKQVGKTCLRDYCGIDPNAFAAANELEDELLGMDIEHHDYVKYPVPRVFDIVQATALAIEVLNRQGYIKSGEIGSNKEVIDQCIVNCNCSEDAMNEAKSMVQAVREMDYDAIESAGLLTYCGMARRGYFDHSMLGYVAYAPVAYRNYIKKEKEKAERKDSMKNSDYVGEIGKRMVIDLASMTLVTSWEGEWGWTYLYRMMDDNGNVLVWYASHPVNEMNRIKATVKAHNEYDGIRQTVLTRCVAA